MFSKKATLLSGFLIIKVGQKNHKAIKTNVNI